MIADVIKSLNSQLPQGTKLVAVSKFHPCEAIMEAYDAGQRIFGENKVQEMVAKYNKLPKDIKWHLIGHLQTNKVKYVTPFVSMIHSVDSFKLLEEINKQAQKVDKTIDCLLQIHIASEMTKFGFSMEECRTMLEEQEWLRLKNIRICGLMGMATNTDDENKIRSEFHSLSSFFKHLKASVFNGQESFCELSMGMTDDYEIAITEGSTLVRIGTMIFGERDYTSQH